MPYVNPTLCDYFVQLLNERFHRGARTTEDAVRFCFHLALLQRHDIEPHRIILECTHPAIERAEVDTWIEPRGNEPGLAVEFKYDREAPGGANANRTKRTGAVFHDLYRLANIGAGYERVFIYVATAEMHAYFTRPRNGVVQFYDAESGQDVALPRAVLEQRSKTLVNAAGPGPDLRLRVVLKQDDLEANHRLRIYRVCNID
jgi:hypothetical protein